MSYGPQVLVAISLQALYSAILADPISLNQDIVDHTVQLSLLDRGPP